MLMKMKFAENEEEKQVEEVVASYANFMKEKETKELLEKWKKKGFKKLGVTELLFKLWLLHGSSKSKKALLREAAEILEKLKGEGQWLSFLSELKFAPEKIFKKA